MSRLEAVSNVLMLGGDSHASTFLDMLAKNGFMLMPMPDGAYFADDQWWYRNDNDELCLIDIER